MTGKRTRIAYLIDSLRIGGTENQLTDMVNRLDRDRFEPLIICIRASDEAYRQRVHCEVVTVRLDSFRSAAFPAALLRLVRLLRRRRIDIVQTYFIDSSIFGVLGARLARVSRVVSCRRDLGFYYSPGILRAFALVNRWVHRFQVNSEAVARRLEACEKVRRERIDVLHNGIDIEAFRRGAVSGDGEPAVLIVANLNRQVKRVDVFVRAAALAAKRCPAARFRIVGDGALRPGLEALAADLGVAGRISFLGSRDDVPALLSRAAVGVISSDSEGFSNSVIEYFAMGVPVVATDVGGNRELVAEGVNGFLVPPGDHRAMAGRIADLLADERRRGEMGAHGRREVEHRFAWPVKMREIEEYYTALLCPGKMSGRWAPGGEA